MAQLELSLQLSKVVENQISLAFTLLTAADGTVSETHKNQARCAAVCACNTAERFVSRLPRHETNPNWKKQLTELRFALCEPLATQ
jgi:hypothetical protein